MKIDGVIAFALEGPDKVGKATQSKMLADAVLGLAPEFIEKKITVRVEHIEIPSRGHVCYDKVYDMLNRREDGSAPAVDHPEVFQTFQVANRFHVQEDLKLMRGHDGPTIIIFDRWVLSSWAYGAASGVEAEKIKAINEGLMKADITFVLNGESFKRPEQADDAYEDDNSFQAQVRRQYEALSQPDAFKDGECPSSKIVSINPNRERDEVHEEILGHVKAELQKRGIL